MDTLQRRVSRAFRRALIGLVLASVPGCGARNA